MGDLWARHAPQLGCSHNLTTSLAAVLWVAGIAISQKQAAHWQTSLREIVTDLFVSLAARLDAWAMRAADAPLPKTIVTQGCGTKQVKRRRRPRQKQVTAAHCMISGSAANVKKGNCLYLAEKRRRMEPCKCYEIVLDRVSLASTYVYSSVTYCTEIDAAGFNVPIESRALKRTHHLISKCGRKAAAGQPISEEDRHSSKQSGMESQAGMGCYDTVRVLNHLITLNAPCKSLGTF